MWKEAVVEYFKVLSQYLFGRVEKTMNVSEQPVSGSRFEDRTLAIWKTAATFGTLGQVQSVEDETLVGNV
jgi:hypothetical protein